jgi:hypothetical protein
VTVPFTSEDILSVENRRADHAKREQKSRDELELKLVELAAQLAYERDVNALLRAELSIKQLDQMMKDEITRAQERCEYLRGQRDKAVDTRNALTARLQGTGYSAPSFVIPDDLSQAGRTDPAGSESAATPDPAG